MVCGRKDARVSVFTYRGAQSLERDVPPQPKVVEEQSLGHSPCGSSVLPIDDGWGGGGNPSTLMVSLTLRNEESREAYLPPSLHPGRPH